MLFSWSNGYSLRFLIKNKWFICGTACFECYPPFNIASCERFVQRKFGSGETIEKSAHGCYNLCKRGKIGMLDAGKASTAFGKMRERATRSVKYSWNEWIRAHSKYRLRSKRVDESPLEVLVMVKTSGLCPTRNSYFTENEWVKPHSKITFFPERVGILSSQNYI